VVISHKGEVLSWTFEKGSIVAFLKEKLSTTTRERSPRRHLQGLLQKRNYASIRINLEGNDHHAEKRGGTFILHEGKMKTGGAKIRRPGKKSNGSI